MKFTNEYRAEFLNGVDKKSRLLLKAKCRKRKAIAALCLATVLAVAAVAASGVFGREPKKPTDVMTESRPDSTPVIILPESSENSDINGTSKPTGGLLLTEVNNFHYGAGSPFGDNFCANPTEFNQTLKLILSDGIEVSLSEFGRLQDFFCNINFSEDEEKVYDVIIRHEYSERGPSGWTTYEVTPWYVLDEKNQKLLKEEGYPESEIDRYTYAAEVYYHRRLLEIESYCLDYWNDAEHKEAYDELVTNGISEEWVNKYGIKAWQRNAGYLHFLDDISPEYPEHHAPDESNTPAYYYYDEQDETLKSIGKSEYTKDYYTYEEFLEKYPYEEFEYLEEHEKDYLKYLEKYEEEHGYTVNDLYLKRCQALIEHYVTETKEAYAAIGINIDSCRVFCETELNSRDQIRTDYNQSEGYAFFSAKLTKNEIKNLKTLFGEIEVMDATDEEVQESLSKSMFYQGSYEF